MRSVRCEPDRPVAYMLLVMRTSAELVRTARERADLSMRALAERSGMAYTTVWRIEHGQIDPTIGTLRKLLAGAGQQLEVDSHDADIPRLAALNNAWHRDGRGQDRPDWTRLRALIDALSLHPELRGPATIARPALSGSDFMDNLLAALAEKLSDDAGLPRPGWTKTVPALSEPWFSPATPRIRAAAESATPPQFAARQIVMTENSLWRDSDFVGA